MFALAIIKMYCKCANWYAKQCASELKQKKNGFITSLQSAMNLSTLTLWKYYWNLLKHSSKIKKKYRCNGNPGILRWLRLIRLSNKFTRWLKAEHFALERHVATLNLMTTKSLPQSTSHHLQHGWSFGNPPKKVMISGKWNYLCMRFVQCKKST